MAAFLETLGREHPACPKPGCARRKNSIYSDTSIKASVATRQPRPTRGDLQICECWRTSSRRVGMSTGPSQRASMLPSTISSPISTFSTSIHLSRSSLWRLQLLSGIALPSMPQSVELHCPTQCVVTKHALALPTPTPHKGFNAIALMSTNPWSSRPSIFVICPSVRSPQHTSQKNRSIRPALAYVILTLRHPTMLVRVWRRPYRVSEELRKERGAKRHW